MGPPRRIVSVVACATFLLVPGACAARATGERGSRTPTLLLEHVAVIDVENGTVRPDQTVTVAGSRIVSVSSTAAATPAPGAIRVDGTAQFLVPGFWDMHVHLGERALSRLVAYGVVAARDMGGDPATMMRWRAEIQEGRRLGPRLIIAGPSLAGPPATDRPSRWLVASPDAATRAADSLAILGVDFVKVWEGIPREAYAALVRSARARGLSVVGHVPASVGVHDVAMAGQRGIEHLEFVPDECLAHFDPRVTASTPTSGCTPAALDSLLSLLAVQSVWLDPTISMFRAYVAPDAYDGILAGFARLTPQLRAHGIHLLTGTDAEDQRIPAGESLHDEFALLVRAGFAPAEVLRSGTIEAARFAGLDKSGGSIAVGKWADLVLLDGDPLRSIENTRRIVSVVRQGQLLTRRQLDSLLADRRPE